MPKAKLYNIEGNIVGDIALPDTLFGVEIDTGLVHEVMTAARAAKRNVIAHTKNRSDVSGGGKKPWKQKGTGRARHGSIRSPIWIGGGVTFGPRNTRVFAKKINKKVRRKALCMALSDKATDEKVRILESIHLPETKTKSLVNLLKKLSVGKRTMIILPGSNKEMVRMSRNLKQVQTVTANAISLLELLRHDVIVMPQDTIKKLEELYS